MTSASPRVRGFLGTMVLAAALLWVAATPAPAEGVRGVAGRDRAHVVSAGENLYGLAQRYGLAIEHLAFANGLDPGRLAVAPGTRLRIPGRRVLPANPPADGLVVNLPERGVFLFRGGRFEKFYPIAIGQPGRFQTPQGSFQVASRVENPTWLPPEWAGMGEVIVPAGPDNPLGDRWIGLSLPGVGLHATTSPMSIGQAASHGCMRMYTASVHELFEKVRVGMPCRIEYETVKAGYDAETGSFYLVSFPDVYGLRDPRAGAAEAMEALGLGGLLDEAELRRLAGGRTGVATQVLASDVKVAVGDRRLDLSVPPLFRNGSLWVSTEVARALGLQVSWRADSRSIEIRQGDVAVEFPVGEAAFLVGGRSLVPIRTVLDTFAMSYRWDPEERTLRIDSRPAPSPSPRPSLEPPPPVEPSPVPSLEPPPTSPPAEPEGPVPGP